jgi:hypothetical protein
MNETNKYKPVSNISNEERQAILSLRNNSYIIIKRADKGGAVVILDNNSYIQEGLRQLYDEPFYQAISSDKKQKVSNKITTFFNYPRTYDLLPNEPITVLKPKHCRTSVFYMLSKIHKSNNPCRPMVSACDSPI